MVVDVFSPYFLYVASLVSWYKPLLIHVPAGRLQGLIIRCVELLSQFRLQIKHIDKQSGYCYVKADGLDC
jgi:hypothetical protein